MRFVAALFALVIAASAQLAGRRFVIDPGHGGSDPGAVGIDGGALPNEEDFVLDIALRLRTRLQNAGADVVMTRTSDATVSLQTRVDISNAADPDVFLSIHCNSFGDSSAHGTETFHATGAPAADVNWATKVQNRMISTWALTNRGVKSANFTVLTANAPAALAETMFISNQSEFDIMNDPNERQRAAEAFYQAFGEFLGIDLSGPVITSHPATTTVNPTQLASFTVAATGSGLTYQWRKNGVLVSNGGRVSGATTTTLNISNVQLSDAAFYTAHVTGGSSTVASNAAQLVVATTPSAVGSGTGFRGTYYDNPDFTALRRARVDATVNFAWGTGSPSSTMQADTFSARWTGQIEPRYTQNYTFYVRSDDGARLWVNGVLLIDKFVDQGATEWSATMALNAGQKYDLQLDYFENAGDALCELRWSAASQMKEIIPATQLYRPPPVFPTQPNVAVLAGQPLNLALAPTSFDPLLSSQPFADFEGETDGATDLVLFRKPQHSSTTNAFTDAAKTREATVVAALPTGNPSTRALLVKWSWAPGAVNPWLRLTTAGAVALPNPVVDFTKALRFDVWSQHTLKFGTGLRETNSSGPIGSDGGVTGPIEWAGVPSLTGGAPNPARILAPDAWTTLEFDFRVEAVRGFTGNGALESTTGLGVLEHLCIAPGSASVDHDVYLDNFVVVEKNALTYALLAAPPGASIDPQTGVLTWTPTAAQARQSYLITVQISDGGTPPRTVTVTFTVAAAPWPDIVSVLRNGIDFTFSWKAAPTARYDIESAPAPNGHWSVLTEVTATTGTAAFTTPLSGTQRFYRARLK